MSTLPISTQKDRPTESVTLGELDTEITVGVDLPSWQARSFLLLFLDGEIELLHPRLPVAQPSVGTVHYVDERRSYNKVDRLCARRQRHLSRTT